VEVVNLCFDDLRHQLELPAIASLRIGIVVGGKGVGERLATVNASEQRQSAVGKSSRMRRVETRAWWTPSGSPSRTADK
jgi:hypothetical protein